MLNELQKINGAVKKGGFKLALKVDIGLTSGNPVSYNSWACQRRDIRFNGIDIVGQIDQGDDVDGKLAKDGPDDVDVENVRLRSLLREPFDGLQLLLASC